MTKTLRIAGFALLALAAFASAGVAGVTFHRTPKEGETTKYRLKADLTIMGQAATVSGLLEQKITKVEADGVYTTEESQLELKANIGGSDMDLPTSGNATVTVTNADGTVKEIVGSDGNADTYRMATITTFVEPGKEVNIGDTWTYEFKTDAKTGRVAAKAEYKYLADEKVGDVDCYKVHAVVNETEGSVPASTDLTLWIDKANGQLLKQEGKWTNAPFPGSPEPINATISLVREA